MMRDIDDVIAALCVVGILVVLCCVAAGVL